MSIFKIRSKLSKVILYVESTENVEKRIQWHKFYLLKRIHPIPALQNHVIKFGFEDFEFITDPVIETAAMAPQKETRRRGKA